MVPSVEAWIAGVTGLACCSSYRQDDVPVTTCGSFGFLPCVRAHSALVTKLHCPEVEVRNDDPIDHCCAVLCSRRRGVGIFSLARVAREPFDLVRDPLWVHAEITRSEEHTSELQSLRHLVC